MEAEWLVTIKNECRRKLLLTASRNLRYFHARADDKHIKYCQYRRHSSMGPSHYE
jgi:hypothetical protein